jgi:hypothetical protein
MRRGGGETNGHYCNLISRMLRQAAIESTQSELTGGLESEKYFDTQPTDIAASKNMVASSASANMKMTANPVVDFDLSV